MRGTNPIRKPVQGDGASLDVQSIFATLQGEGPYAGWPAIFIRLGGCNLACSFCDTEFESFRAMTLNEIMAQVQSHAAHGAYRLIVITGGEPLRQPIAPLCDALIGAGYRVQLESNGTLWRELPDGVEIICSPKHTGGGYHAIRPDMLSRTQALKFLISASQPGYGDVPDFARQAPHIPIYVQPMDEMDAQKNAANRALAVQLAQSGGYRLSLQLHKILGIE
jgi:organic radical activating enzyme